MAQESKLSVEDAFNCNEAAENDPVSSMRTLADWPWFALTTCKPFPAPMLARPTLTRIPSPTLELVTVNIGEEELAEKLPVSELNPPVMDAPDVVAAREAPLMLPDAEMLAAFVVPVNVGAVERTTVPPV